MNDTTKTIALLALAGGLVGLVVVTRPTPGTPALISDQGQPLAPALSDPLAVKALEVISFDQQAAKLRAFKVAFDGKRWVIPSHSGYPADAADKVSAAASAFAGLIKERVVTDDKAAHASLGLLDPGEDQSGPAPANADASGAAFGTRVTLRDASDRPLADIIIGKAPPKADSGSPFDGPSNKRYVREAGKNRVYITTLTTGFSTKFIDWVQADLLQCTGDQIAAIDIDRYKIDENRGITTQPESVSLVKPTVPQPAPGEPAPPTGPLTWTMSAQPGGGPGPGQIINQQRVDEVVAALTGLRIVGVRAKPANLAKALSGSSNEAALTVTDQISLGTRGFYLAKSGRLLANEGQLAVRCTDGVIYSLWFGEVVPESEDAASGGQVGAESPATPSATEKPGPARYLMITVSHEPAIVPEPEKPEALLRAEELFAVAKAAYETLKSQADAQSSDGGAEPTPQPAPAQPPAEPPGQPPAEPASDSNAAPANSAAEVAKDLPQPPVEPPELVSLRQQHEAAVAAWKARLENGKKRADTLGRRFADWYYVISADSLGKLRPTRDELIKPAEAPPAEAVPAADPSTPEPPAAVPVAPGEE